MRELHWGATPVSSRTFAPVATPEPANPGDEVDDAWWAGTLETKLTMPGCDGVVLDRVVRMPLRSVMCNHVRVG